MTAARFCVAFSLILGTSFNVRAGDWPITIKELLEKKITIKHGPDHEPAYWVVHIKEKQALYYLPTYRATLCHRNTITEISVLSEDEIQLTIVAEKKLDAWARCGTMFPKINLKEKTYTNFRLRDDGVTLYQSGFWKGDRVQFD